jgi:hypothetical protein
VHERTNFDITPLEASVAAQLPEGVLFRIVKGDAKGRSFGTPANPRPPTMEEFNPRIVDVRAGELSRAIVERRHGLVPDQVQRIAEMSNEALDQFILQDPISATWQNGLSLTGGHHRVAEIIARTESGQLDVSTLIRVLIHD